jgi:hypothetical protein
MVVATEPGDVDETAGQKGWGITEALPVVERGNDPGAITKAVALRP